MGVMDRYNEKKKRQQGTSASGTTSNGVMQRYEQNKYYNSFDTSVVNDSYINSFISDSDKFLIDAQNSYKNLGWSNASSSYDTVSNTWKDLKTRKDIITAWLRKNKNVLSDEKRNSVAKSLVEFSNIDGQSIIDSFKSGVDYYSNWATEDEYNEWNKYSWVPETSDFEEKSKYVSTYRGGEHFNVYSGMYDDTGFDDLMYDYINGDEKALSMHQTNSIQNNAAFLGVDQSERREMNSEEISIFNYIYATEGKDAAYDYVDHITTGPVGLTARQREEQTKLWAKMAKDNPVGASVFSVIEAPFKGLSFIGQMADYAHDGIIDQNAGYNKFSYANSAIRNQVTYEIEQNWGEVGSFAYQTGMSMADFLFTTAITGGGGAGEAYALAIMGTGAAADTVIYAKDRGLSDDQAFTLGVIAGSAEIITEKVSIDALLDTTTLGKSAVGYIIKNALAEGSEEVASSTINLVADVLISKDKSEWQVAINAYMESGMSESEAFWHAVSDQALSLGMDFLGGAISGGIMGGGGAVINTIDTTIQGSQYKNLGIDADLTRESLEIDPNNSFAQKMQNKVNKGKSLSSYQIGKLVRQNETSMYDQDVSAIKKAASERLTQLGETGNVEAIAKALTKQAQGEKLTFAEKQTIKNSKYGQRVANELNTENIKSGEYSSAWAEQIGTNRINAEEYSRALANAEVVTDTNTTEAIQTVESPSLAPQASAQAIKTAPVTENATVKENATESEFEASESVSENEETEGTVTLEAASAKYGAQAQAMIHTYTEGQNVAEYDKAYKAAYDMGMSGVSLSYAMSSDSTAYLTEKQRELAHEAGKAASDTAAKEQDAKNKANANGKTGRRKGVVKGEGVTIADLKKSFNDTQNTAYKVLTTYAEATGVDIVLYKSEADADGNFIGSQGKFKWSEDTIYIDVNAGLSKIKDVNDLAKYAMLRTFSHEFTHFIEKWNPIWYNEFRKAVFDELTARGENVHDLIETKMSMNEGMTYDKASREVVAEAMTDILPDANFVETLATKHKNIFDKLLDKLKEFLADLKAYFKTIGHNPSKEANALKEQVGEAVHYVDNIVKLFDKVALEAVENYQATVATEEATVSKMEQVDETVDETVAENTNQVDEKGEGDAFTITDNAEYGTLEIKFDGKPSEAIRDVLKEHKFRWHGKKGIWYGKGKRADIVKALREAYKAEEADPYGLTDDEIGSIVRYKSGGSYTLNAKLRENAELNEYDQETVNHLDKALEKLPTYKGVVYRNIQFDGFGDKAARDAYIEGHIIGEPVFYNAYTSASTVNDGYVLDGDFVVHHIIQSVNGRNLAGYGSDAESEVLFSRNSIYFTNKIEYDSDGTPTIYLTEVANERQETKPQTADRGRAEGNVQGDNSGESRQHETSDNAPSNKVAVQSVQGENTEGTGEESAHNDLQGISERNTEGNVDKRDSLQEVHSEVKAAGTVEAWVNPFDKNTTSLLKKAKKVGAIDFKGKNYVSDGMILIPTTKEGVRYAYAMLNAATLPPDVVHTITSSEYTPVEQAPTEGKFNAVQTVYAFDIGDKKRYFDKKLLSYLDGGALYYSEYKNNVGVIKSVNEDGSVKGYLLGMIPPKGSALIDEKPSKLKSFSKKTNAKEVNKNGENADNKRPILEPDTDGERASRSLDESQTENVQGTSSERKPLEDTRQRESEVGRIGDRTDAADRLGRSDGNSESGDSRELTEEEKSARDYASEKGYKIVINELALKKGMTQVDIYDKNGLPTFSPIIINNASDWNKVKDAISNHEEREKIKAEELTETVEREIENKSTEKPKGNNFVIGDSLNLPKGDKARFRANVDAIRLIKQLEAEGRFATAEEQEILSKYVGWGGLSNAFGELIWNRETRRSEMTPKDDWKNEFAELKGLVDEGIITEQEYKDMSASTKNAHYTSVEVIKAMYDGLKQLGFNGGRMLEPSSGVGNFVGAMPTEMTAKVNSWTMVEIERVTGLIAKYLYPNSDVRIQGFENANIPDNYMDVAIGNVPFGDYGVVDRTYPKRITKSIHNYFFAKSIDKVRPGGIVMFVTSSFTMNGKDTTVRQYIMERADLLGAIRLPNTAFKGNAGTDVVTDILILKKRKSGTEYAGEDFLEAEYDYNYGTYTSNYFKNHPEMVLGKPVTKRGMYGASTLTFEPYTDRGTIDDQIREAFKNIKGKMDYSTKPSPEKTNFAVEKADKKTKSGGLVVNSDGSISRNENGQLVKYDTDEKTAKRIAGLLSIRDAYKTLANYLQQGQDAKYIKQARTALNAAYDKFVKEYGYINSPANRKAIESDPDRYSILSLENYDAKKKSATKADIFSKDTISANKTITHVDSVEEGVIASINLTGGVDTALIAKLTGKTVDDVTREIIDTRLAFKTRNNGLVARESYLSGNVRAKLRDAEALAPYDKDFNNNIEELRKIIPADIPYNEIYITPGNAFIPNEVYADFIAHMLGGRNNPNSYSGPDVEVGRMASGDFKIILNNKRLKGSYYNTQTWGTARKSFLDIIDAMMGSRTVKVNDTIEGPDGRKVSVVNEAETEAANEKVKAIQKEFEDWIWKDENRRTELARLYNETFNAIVNPKYDGSHLSVNGINAAYSLRPHQANAVHRIISSGGNTLLAHRVGAGKTLEMAAAAMKMRELGVIKKPVFVVPKNVVAQWGVEFHSYFPAARLLVADDKSFTPANRKIFTNQIANGDYDAVIVSYEQFEKIPMSVEYQQRFYEEQIDEIINAIAEEKAESRDGKGLTVKEMEKKKAQLEKKLKELTSKPKDENNIDFEMLGIDSLFVDEAHNFKNLEYVSKMSNVAGLGPSKGAQRAFDLYTKIRYLQGLNGGRGIVFATATPVMNSMVELYIMQRYLQPDVLNQLNLKSFDAWAKQFGEVVNKWEINPSGTGMRQKQVFANFRNLNELQLLFRSFADVLTDVPGLKIPKMKGGAVKIVECEPGEFQKNYMQALQKRAENVKNVDPTEDNMLKITSDGRKVSYTQRMIDPTLPYEPACKIFKAAENILKEYNDSANIKGTQIVFLDMATPKGTDKSKAETNTEDSVDDGYDEENARLYDDMRDYLVKNGIPKSEIAFIHEANTDVKKAQLFEDVNNGKVRVLMGSTGKMGVGMNAQKRVVAIHHLDAPWRPGDVEQRDGRAFRQKNINDEVSKYVYVTKGSFDSRLWDILDRKQHFINQIMNGEDVGRTAEDTGEVTLSAAEVKALASGNPLIEEQTKLTDAIKKLENLQKAYNSSIVLAKTKLSDDEAKITLYTNRIARIREDIKARVDTYSDDKFSMTVGKQTFTDKKEAGVALAAEIAAKANADTHATVAKFAGFELKAFKNGSEYNGYILGKESYKFNVYMNNTTRMVNHIGEVIAGFENMIKNTEQMIAETTADRDAQKNILAQPFEKQDELNQKRARFNEVMELLAPKTEEQLGKTDDDTVQEQSRAYLNDIDSEYMDAVNRGDMATAQSMVDEAAEKYLNSMLLPNDNDEVGFKYHRGKAPTKTFTRYAVFNVSEDGFRAAYAGNKNATPVGVWLDAQNLQSYTSDMVQFDDGTFASYIPGDTGAPTNTKFSPDRISEYGLRGGQRWLLERGGKHSSDVPNFSQMNLKVNENGEKVASGKDGALPHNKLVFEIEYGITDDGDLTDYVRENGRMMKGKNQGLAKIEPNQYYDFKTNPNAVGNWGIGGTFRITRIVPHNEIVSVTNKYKQDSITEANRLFNEGKIDKNARDARIKNANAIQVQKWVGGYNPAEFGITEEAIQDMVSKGRKMKLTDAVTYDDNGNVIPLSQRFNIEMDDIRYQQRTDTLTDREVLELAANEVKVSDLTQAEQDALTIFQDRLSNLKDLQDKRAEQGRLYKEQQFGEKVDRKAAEETLNRMHILDDQIKKATSDILTVEEKEVLKRVLKKARKVVEAQEREHGKEILNRWRDRRNNAAAIKKYRDRLRGDVDELSNWILHPNNKDIVKHVPDVLKNSVIPFLSSINFMSKRALNGGAATKADAAFMDTLRRLNSAIKTNIDAHGMYSGYNDLPPNFMENLQRFIDSTDALVKNNSGTLVINQMTSEELKELSQVVRTLKKYIMQVNSFHYNAMYSHVYEAGENSIEHLAELGNAGNTGAVSKFLLWDQIRPAYAFERFGKGGIAIYDGLRRGQAKLAFNTKEIQAFTEKAYTEKEVKAWENEIKTFSLGRDIVKMPVSYIMAFYELSKDPEALEHINGEGIRVATFTHKGKKISDTGHILTLGEFNQIIGSLTDRQREVADSLQKYMAEQGGKWGNYVSVARFGEELFTNKKYFPINSDGRHLQANADEHPSAASLYALLNMSFTKSRQEGANNRIVIYSIFDVFANHMASMAQYNAMALPILDALKWFNYQQVFFDDQGNKQKGESVRERMDRAYGVPEENKPGSGRRGYAQDFVMNIIKAFNGTEAQGTPFDSFGLKSLHRYNVAQVAYNARVVIQQPLAITRAAMLLDYGSIIKGMKLKPSAIKQNIEEMQKYSGIAAWKSLGFYDVNISRGLTHLIKHDSTVMDKIDDVGMWGAEKADLLTWAAMWSAAKEEVRKKEHLTPESDGFYEAVTTLFEDIIYKTQVVDSVLTKNEFMRDKGTFARLVGSFMSEPTTNASMLIDAYDKYALDIQRGMTRQQAWKKNGKMIGRRLYVYAVGAILLAAVQAVADALRDDDDYEEGYEKWLEAFGGNLVDELMPFNKLPILSDFYDLAKELLSIFGVDTYGNPPQSVFMQWYDSLVKGTEIIYQKIMDEDTNYTWYSGIYKLLQAASGISGLPMASATREIVTAWNNTIGAMAPSLKLKDYEPSELSQIRYAYVDGYLTDMEAAAQILDKGLAESENDAYATVAYWQYMDEHPNSDVYVDWFKKYYSDVAPSGMSMDEYISYRNEVRDITGEDKKARRMEVINSLPITVAQKDALYFAEGWAESKLDEAPWH